MALTPPSAVLFDFDYTLGDSSEGIVLCANRALEALGRPPAAAEAIHRTIGLSLETMFEHLTGENGPAAIRFKESFIACADGVMSEHTRLYPGVPEMLRGLRARGLGLGVVTTKRAHRVLDVARRDGIAELFDVIVGSDTVRRPKPDPEGLLLASERLGVAPENVLYVGDSPVDGEAAAAAGVPFLAVTTGATPPSELERFRPLALLERVTELPGWLAQRWQ